MSSFGGIIIRIGMLSSIDSSTPPKKYGPWESVVSLLTEGLVKKGIDVTLFATADSHTSAKLHAACPKPYEEDKNILTKVCKCLHISEVFERANEFDIIHNHLGYIPLTYSAFVNTPVVTTIHGISSSKILPVYKKYNNKTFYVSISNAEAIRSRRFKVVVDTGCGAGSLTLPFLLSKLGCQVLTLEAQPDGTFPWRNPEPLPEALTELTKLVKITGADMGAAHDGDADRVVLIDENGEFINAEVLLAMMTKYILEHEKGPIVTPVSSSQRMAYIAKDADIKLYWTAVGSINVARKMMEVNAVFGGEGNGGLIFPKHQYCRDGAMACAMVLEILANGKKISDLAKSVPEYFNAKTKVPSKNIQATMEIVKQEASGLGFKIDTIDEIKIWYEDGWVLIRPSGTEPILRVFAEAKQQDRTEELMQKGLNMVKRAEKASTCE
jgi:phosphomannomutase